MNILFFLFVKIPATAGLAIPETTTIRTNNQIISFVFFVSLCALCGWAAGAEHGRKAPARLATAIRILCQTSEEHTTNESACFRAHLSGWSIIVMNHTATCKYCGAKVDGFDESSSNLEIFKQHSDPEGVLGICDHCKLSVLENRIDVIRLQQRSRLRGKVIFLMIVAFFIVGVIVSVFFH